MIVETDYDRTPLTKEAEAIALEMVELTEAERAAHRARTLSDPFSWPTYRDLHERAVRDLDACRCRFLVALTQLGRAGLELFAANLHDSTISQCVVARERANRRLEAELKQAPRRAAR